MVLNTFFSSHMKISKVVKAAIRFYLLIFFLQERRCILSSSVSHSLSHHVTLCLINNFLFFQTNLCVRNEFLPPRKYHPLCLVDIKILNVLKVNQLEIWNYLQQKRYDVYNTKDTILLVLTMPLLQKLRRKGPRIEPCGTPILSVLTDEECLFQLNKCLL